MARPFEGIRVLDATHVLAGPYCSYQLGLLGAAVIKVENPREPDPVRGRGPVPALNAAGLGFNYFVQGSNKRSLTLDLKQPQGKAIFLQLAAEADVVVENWRAGAFPAMGLGYEDIRAINPDVVYCSLNAFGQEGPFVPSAMLAGMSFESFVQFPGLLAIQPGAYGPYYEFRTYVMKTGGLAPTIAAWQGAIPGRTKLSPLVTVMHSLDGEPRFVHVWAYDDLKRREEIRAEAFASGVWPAPGAPGWLTENLKTEIFMPTPISRLT